jgi:uncharacterized DUF497 family protein
MFEPSEFEWDDAKAASNFRKHGVSFIGGARVFLDAARVEWDVSRPADLEARWKVVGYVDGRLLTVVFTIRDGKCRIISARPVNAAEERAYGNRSLHT